MNLILCDELCYKIYFDELKKNFDYNEYKIDNISNFNYENSKNFEKVYCIFTITYNFFEPDVVNFLKTQKNFDNIEFVLLMSDKTNDLSKKYIICGWLRQISIKLDKNFQLKSVITRNFLNEIIKVINAIKISDNKKLKDTSNYKNVEIYTDGACSGNPGNGGWSFLIKFEGELNYREFSGGEKDTTNNRMELFAVIKAIEELDNEPCNVTIHSDSAYVVNAFEKGWINLWKSRNWKNSDEKPVKNLDLWQRLNSLLSNQNYSFVKVQGHSDNELNNRCDELAVNETLKLTCKIISQKKSIK